jgi:hypothetical protein
VTDEERERAWAAVHDALAQMPGWAVGPCVYHGDGDLWHVTAVDLRPRGRQAKREAITARRRSARWALWWRFWRLAR